jgi:hypothetical protein
MGEAGGHRKQLKLCLLWSQTAQGPTEALPLAMV